MFSNDSRWDRHTPDQDRNEDVIDVAVIFKKGKILPKSFKWKDRKYPINEITYYWQDKRGSEVLHYFSVSDGSNLYQIYLNNRHMHWRLAKVCPLE